MFRRSHVYSARIRERLGTEHPDAVFDTFVRSLIEQCDGPFRVTPILAEALEGARFEHPGTGKDRLADLLLGLTGIVLEPRAPGFGASASGSADAQLANLAKAARALKLDLDEAEEFLDWPSRSPERWGTSARRLLLQAIVQHHEDEDAAAAPPLDTIAETLSRATGAEPGGDAEGLRHMLAAIVSGGALQTFHADLAARAIACLVEAQGDPVRGEAILSEALRMACALSGSRAGGPAGQPTPVLDARSRLIPILCARAPEDSPIDMIFALTLVEFVERTDLPLPRSRAAAEALGDLPLGAHVPSDKQLVDMARLVVASLREVGVSWPDGLDGSCERASLGTLGERLSRVAHGSIGSLPAAWTAESETWSPARWQSLALAHLGEALWTAHRVLTDVMSPPPSKAFHQAATSFAQALACGVRGSGNPAESYVFVLHKLRGLARVDVES